MNEKSCQEDLFCGVNRAADVDGMSDLEKKHTPIIEAPASASPDELINVSVEVGKLLRHPNENGHFIQWVELYSGDTFITRVELTPKVSEPRVTIPVRLQHVHGLRAKARCNLHGTWESEHHFR